MNFVIDADGDVLYTSKVPGQGEQRLKLVDGATLEVKALGTKDAHVDDRGTTTWQHATRAGQAEGGDGDAREGAANST